MAVTEVTFVIDPDVGTGADYQYLSDWEAAEVTTSLIADDEQYTVKCRSTGGSVDNDNTTFSTDWVTDSTHFIKIWTDPADTGSSGGGKDFGSGATHRHDGKWNDNAARFDLGSGHIMWIPAGSVDYIRIIGLQFDAAESSNARCIRHENTAGEMLVEQCIFRQSDTPGFGPIGIGVSGGASGAITAKISNCVFYDFTNSGVGVTINSSSIVTAYIYNCTAHNCATGFSGGFNATTAIKNCTAQDCSNGFDGSWDTSATNNSDISSDAPGEVGSGEVLFIDEANDDFHLDASDTVCYDTGTDLSADANYPISVDIDNQTRSVWSIGADDGTSTSTPQELSATIASGTGATADLTVERVLGATCASATGTSADLTVARPASATLSSATDLNADITVARVLGATCASGTDASADLTVARPVSATIASGTDTDADLTVARPVSATLSSATGLTADLTINPAISATIASATDVDAALTVARVLGATVSSATALTADLSTSIDEYLDALWVDYALVSVLGPDTGTRTVAITDTADLAVAITDTATVSVDVLDG